MKLILPLAIVAIAASPQLGATDMRFSDQTQAAGLSLVHKSTINPRSGPMPAGGAVGDFNGDGYPDLFVLGGGDVPDALYINKRNGTFVDYAKRWGVDKTHRGIAATVADYDDDGDDDIYVTSFGRSDGNARGGRHMLYNNQGGSFTDFAQFTGVNQTTQFADGYGSAFGDYDRDGDLDLFVGSWHEVPVMGSRLFRNDGDGTYSDVTDAAGIITGNTHAFGAVWADMDGDRYPELLIAGDFGTNRYLRNNKDGTFTEMDPGTGTPVRVIDNWSISKAHNGMGTTVADMNRDGRPDWFITAIWPTFQFANEFWGNGLYLNQGDHIFTEVSVGAGVNDGGWGWGTVAIDMDNDTHIDLAMTNGWPFTDQHTGATFTDEQSYLWRNRGDTTFEEVSAAAGFDHPGQGRTMLHLDYDRDGDIDIVILSNNEPMKLLRNDIILEKNNWSEPRDARWLQVKLDTSGNPNLAPHGAGALITVETGGVKQTKQMTMGGTFLGQSELVAHFGLSRENRVEKITVDWGNGKTTQLRNYRANQRRTIRAPCPPRTGMNIRWDEERNCSRSMWSP